MLTKFQWAVNHLFVLCMIGVVMAYIFSNGFNSVSLYLSFAGIGLQFLNLFFVAIDHMGD